MLDSLVFADTLRIVVYDTVQITILDTSQVFSILDRVVIDPVAPTTNTLPWWALIAQPAIAVAAIVGIVLSFIRILPQIQQIKNEIARIRNAAELDIAIEALRLVSGDKVLERFWQLRMTNFGRRAARNTTIIINGEPINKSLKVDYNPFTDSPLINPYETRTYDLRDVAAGEQLEVDITWSDDTSEHRSTHKSLLVDDPKHRK